MLATPSGLRRSVVEWLAAFPVLAEYAIVQGVLELQFDSDYRSIGVRRDLDSSS
jgi:hypothetical protein